MINIGNKMKEIVKSLQEKGFAHVPMDGIEPECLDRWNEHYSIVCGFDINLCDYLFGFIGLAVIGDDEIHSLFRQMQRCIFTKTTASAR